MAPPLTVAVEPMAFEQDDTSWLDDLRPFVYQQAAYAAIQEAIEGRETRCLFLVTPTGSGKTLASYAYAINQGLPALGVYPTNELIHDQEQALRPWLDPQNDYRLIRIDSQQLDEWQALLDLGRHAPVWERLLNWRPTLLTNPDILFYTFFGLYRGPAGLTQRLQTLLAEYRLFVFDEFHLYNVKQMADVVFFAGALHAINPNRGRVFVFASATPASPARTWLAEKLQMPVVLIEGQPSAAPDARTIAHPLELTLLPADLQRWQGVAALAESMPMVDGFLAAHPQARLVTILDSVAGAIEFADLLRTRYPSTPVGEVHGFSSDQEREEALRRLFTVGTSTIEVGIDFKGPSEKDLLIFEARTASQFIQRLGRLARHPKESAIPNHALALVPEYVYHHLAAQLSGCQTIQRPQLYALIRGAYETPEDFARYLRVHAPAEFIHVHRQVGSLFHPDERPRIQEAIAQNCRALTGKTTGQSYCLYRSYSEEEHILAPLLTFRGNSLEAAILDERGSDPGCPIKRYSLFFLLRRGAFQELDESAYLAKLDELADTWPVDVTRERRYSRPIGRKPEELLGVYGYFALQGLMAKARRVWFEIDRQELEGRVGRVAVLERLEIVTDPPARIPLLNRRLRRKRIVAWCIDRHPASIRLGRALPPLFELYELRVRGAGSSQSWAIALNQDAFFVDSLGWQPSRQAAPAIIL